MTSRLTLLTKAIIEGDVVFNRSNVYSVINVSMGKANRGTCPHMMINTGINCDGCSFPSMVRFNELMRLLDTYE